MPPRARSGPRAPWRLGRRHLIIALTALLLAAPGPSMLHTCEASSSKPSSRDALRAMAKAFSAQNQQAQQAQPYSGPKRGIKGLYYPDSPENSPVPGDLNNPECLYFRMPWYNENGDPSHRVCRGDPPAPPSPVTAEPSGPGPITSQEIPERWFGPDSDCDCGAAPGFAGVPVPLPIQPSQIDAWCVTKGATYSDYLDIW
eukprot:CAMPEP_0182863514 /NCGR_PEP_ID=MMETSP0034_2-20130328/6688_1 /TAXON_ID=156128 /ORGANISM="Nephroselmis pyriformis, Strain CCMP717" /LENGTH=199 /DNA_ID=CAMNT_0024995731 /DNA_START=1147 /DNA_END=1743 /DNA_ORIENTATION=-